MRRSRKAYAVNDLLELIEKVIPSLNSVNGILKKNTLLKMNKRLKTVLIISKKKIVVMKLRGEILTISLWLIYKVEEFLQLLSKKYAYRWRSHRPDPKGGLLLFYRTP